MIVIFGVIEEEMGNTSLQFFIKSLSHYFDHYCDTEEPDE
jgi:hypothetical protein